MIKSDAEMEGAEKLPDKSGEKAQDSQDKILVSEVESYTETVPVEDVGQGNDKKTDVEGDYLRKCSVAARDEATEKGVVEAQTHPDSEVVEPMDTSAEPVVEQTNEKSGNAELNQSNTQGEEQIDGDSAVEKQTNVDSGLVGQNTTNGGLESGQSTNNGLASGINVDSVEEKHSADIVDKLLDGSDGVDPNCGEHVTEEMNTMKVNDMGNDHLGEEPLPSEISTNKAAESKSAQSDGIPQAEDKGMEVTAVNSNEGTSAKDEIKEQGKEIHDLSSVTDRKANMTETTTHLETEDFSHQSQQEPATPKLFVSYSPSKDGDHSEQAAKTVFTHATLPMMPEGDDGTPEEQAAFMKELESFYRGRAMDFKPPKFYGQPLNCLKLWRSVIRLGGYDRVTGSKLWRQVGESFHPPKTCTTVSWTFRIFYEKSLLEFERHKKQCGELQLPLATLPEAAAVENEGNGYQGPGSVSGRARRDAAARAMQGWHVQRIFDNGEVGEPVIKDKNASSSAKREKNLKSIGSIKQKRPNEVENSVKVARTESFKQLVTSVVDVGPPADWVKINIRQTKDCFEVYALVPGLLREEVRVQSDPAGRLVITGQPEQVDNPWGITPFKKVVTLPARIDPLQTSAVVSLHGRLFVRVPFEQPNV